MVIERRIGEWRMKRMGVICRLSCLKPTYDGASRGIWNDPVAEKRSVYPELLQNRRRACITRSAVARGFSLSRHSTTQSACFK